MPRQDLIIAVLPTLSNVYIPDLQLRVWASHEVFVLRKLIIVLQTLWIGKCFRGFDNVTGHDLLDRKLDLLSVDCVLS